jgi:hyperosmotically inducible protein
VDERSVGQQAADKSIEAAVFKGFVDDKIVKARDISTFCFNGDVFLVGEYESAAQKSRAEQIARGVEGVRSVTSYLLPKKDDPACGMTENTGLILKVKKELVADTDISSTNVEMKAVQCRVVLLGLVGSAAQAAKAEGHARSVAGVRSVTSYLKGGK